MEATNNLHRLMATSLSSAARPTQTQYLLEIGLAQGTTFFVDKLRTSMLKRGSVPAAAAAIIGGAVFRSIAFVGAEVAANTIHNHLHTGQKRAWYEGVGSAAIYGAKNGAVSGAVIATANPIYNAAARTLPKLNPIILSTVTSTVTGAASSTLAAAIQKDTWKDGTHEAFRTIGALTAIGATRGAISGGAFKTLFQKSPMLNKALGWMPIGRTEKAVAAVL